ncbi:MAG: C25 family cysteine peptidase [Acidobacteriota bacterium]
MRELRSCSVFTHYLILTLSLMLASVAHAQGTATVATGADDVQSTTGAADRVEAGLDTANDMTEEESGGTTDDIREAAEEGREEAGDGTYIFYYLGHGAGNSTPPGSPIGSDHASMSPAAMIAALDCPNRASVLIMDSCFSGQWANPIADACCTILTSTPPNPTGDEALCPANPLVGGGGFTAAVSNGLEGAADASGDGRVTLGELAQYLTDNYDNPGTRRHYTNMTEKMTEDLVLSTYMTYEVCLVVGDVVLFDPDDPDAGTGEVNVGDELRNCYHLRVPKDGKLVVKRTIGDKKNSVTFGEGEVHLPPQTAAAGEGIKYELRHGFMMIEEDGLSESGEHAGALASTVSLTANVDDDALEPTIRYWVFVDPVTRNTSIENLSSSGVSLVAVETGTPNPDSVTTLVPEDALELNFAPSVHLSDGGGDGEGDGGGGSDGG